MIAMMHDEKIPRHVTWALLRINGARALREGMARVIIALGSYLHTIPDRTATSYGRRSVKGRTPAF